MDCKDILSTNQLYLTHRDRWRYLYNSYIGGDSYRRAGYLTRYQNETDKEYHARCEATPLDNQCKSVISIYNSFLFRVPPERDFGSEEGSPILEQFLEDTDLDGRSIDHFMREVSIWSQVFGHTWILLSKPNINAQTLAEEQILGIRPYASILTPLVVLDWRWERAIDGRYFLSYFKYIEEVNDTITTIKEWSLEEIWTYVVDTYTQTVLEESLDVNGLGSIPAIIAYSDKSIVRGIGVSAIDDISDMQKYIYNALSEADQSIRLDSHPSLVATPDSEIGTGAGSVINIPDNLDPGLKPYVLDFTGASISSIYEVINNTISSIEKISNVGAVRATEARSISGVAMQTEFQLLNSRLSTIADNMELAEEQMWRLYCQYQNIEYDFEIEYPDSFAIHDVDNQLQQLQTASSIVTDPAIKLAIEQKVAEIVDVDWMDAGEPNEIEEPEVPDTISDTTDTEDTQ